MKTFVLTTLAAIAAVFFLPVDLDVQASFIAAAGLIAIVFSDYARAQKTLSVRADLVPFPRQASQPALVEAA